MICNYVPYSMKVWWGKVWRTDSFEHLAKKVWWINRSANRLLIVSANLDGFNLMNHGWFAKFTKFSPHQTFLLYGTKPIQFL